MPYIPKNDRKYLHHIVDKFTDYIPSTEAGDLNYLISTMCNLYLKSKGRSYKHYNEIIGVLESAKLEYYRRSVAPYEDEKIKENGDLE